MQFAPVSLHASKILTENKVPGSVHQTFTYLLQCLPAIFPAQKTIAKKLGLSLCTVNRAIRTLEKLGMIKKYRFYRRSSVYEINCDLIPGKIAYSNKLRTMQRIKQLISQKISRTYQICKTFFDAPDLARKSQQIQKSKTYALKTEKIFVDKNTLKQKPSQIMECWPEESKQNLKNLMATMISGMAI